MLGFIYADYRDPTISDRFHQHVCNIFQELSIKHREHVLALTDPNVTGTSLRFLYEQCDFVFYWGHGGMEQTGTSVIWGSSEQEYVPVDELVNMLEYKVVYLDACDIGSYLQKYDIGESYIIAPRTLVNYDESVRFGCNFISAMFGKGTTVECAYAQAALVTSMPNNYQLFGQHLEYRINVNADVRFSVNLGFSRILWAWLNN